MKNNEKMENIVAKTKSLIVNISQENKMNIEEMIKVMQHFADGGEVEFSHKEGNSVFGEAIK